jgi:hypothetical protein
MKRSIIEKAGYINEVEPPDAPGEPFRQRDHYSNIIENTFALIDTPCDSSDIQCLNEELENHKLKIIKEIDPEKYWGYTAIVQDSNGDLYAVRVGEDDESRE